MSQRQTAVCARSLVILVQAFPLLAQPAPVVVTVDRCLPTDDTAAVATASGPRDDCSYTWSISGGTILGGQGTQNLEFTWAPPAHDIAISAEAAGPNGCSGTGTAIARTGLVASASGDATICRGYSTRLAGSGGSSCTWTPADGLDDPNSCTPLATPTRTTQYFLQVTDGEGCPSTNDAAVSITLPLDPPDRIVVRHSLPANTPGLTAVAGSSPGPRCGYQWSIQGGTITSSPFGNSVTFTSGPPGSRLALAARPLLDCQPPGTKYGRAQVDFTDVPPEDSFHGAIAEIGRRRITAGCGGGNFCPEAPVRRDQTAALLMKAAHGAACIPPACEGRFADVPCSSPFASWVEMLAGDGLTAGCGGGNFCPDRLVTRAQMAVYLLKSRHGADHVPTPCTRVFADVDCSSPFADWVEAAYMEGTIGACQADPLLFCPYLPVTREWMARFLVQAFFH